jgi:hypothetical protein
MARARLCERLCEELPSKRPQCNAAQHVARPRKAATPCVAIGSAALRCFVCARRYSSEALPETTPSLALAFENGR